MQPIKPTKVRHIKLGDSSKWAKECIEESHTLRLGFNDTNHASCLAKKWGAIRKHFLSWGHDRRTSTRFVNEIKEFYEADENVLWITFHDGLLWWCFSEPVITRMPNKTKTRPAIGGWKCKSIAGKSLDFRHLSEELLKKRMFNGTICKVNESLVLGAINGRARHSDVEADESVIDALEKNQARGQGFQIDSTTRKAIEDYAMEAATKHFESLGYKVEDHHKGHPYDLLCLRKRERLHVEVKGTVTSGDGIILTSGEVKFARSHKKEMGLFILHSVQVSADGKVSDGTQNVIVPWDVDDGKLNPMAFNYEVP